MGISRVAVPLIAKTWEKELQRQGRPEVVIALAGNKLDREQERQVSADEARQYSDENGLSFIETSAKTNINVRELFLAIARKLPKDTAEASQRDKRLILEEDFNSGGNSKKCC